MPGRPSRQLATFSNPHPQRDYVIRHECPEYTALCPVTGQPDFGTIVVVYTPDRHCIELKSLKLYLWSFRDEGHFFEQVTNQILDDLVRACRPRRMTVIGRFNVRGGIASTVVARHPASTGRTARRAGTRRGAERPGRRGGLSARRGARG
ncbi:MAG: NADPH-dependent 7-cyano-7-deazaguanine reductase QueF [Candidatus Eisenbacteria bacterium]|uniref:NADPH-dependent 7-cyano-7-deazaguanine reductase n=1 Tax=Eiseniibacteriota bacterium TaxID=2212470 RepID=A0A538U7N9_UNCEI|nr:MAG: NADPH-dependent 7-cyano-7-deazaguanine reductase QueF [Candidatus Eisenbacteria bacterium]